MRTNFWLKDFPHLPHLSCLAAAWILRCWVKAELPLKDFPQSSHTKILSSWSFWWMTTEDLYLNLFPHSRHAKPCFLLFTPESCTCVCLGLKAFSRSSLVLFLFLCWEVPLRLELLFGFSVVWVACCRWPEAAGQFFPTPARVEGFCDFLKSQLFANEGLSAVLTKSSSPLSCSWSCWQFALKENCFPHAPQLSLCSVSRCSVKWKISVKTGPHISQGWMFWEDWDSLEVLACGTPTGMLCSHGSSTFFVPQQQPKCKEMMVNYTLTLLARGNPTTNV